MPSVDTHFPIKFEDTGFTMETMNFVCAHCDKAIPTKDVHGSVSRLVPKVVDMDLLGMCSHCRVVTVFKMRIRSNRWCEWLNNATDKWESFKVYAPGVEGVKDSLKDMFTAIKHRVTGG